MHQHYEDDEREDGGRHVIEDYFSEDIVCDMRPLRGLPVFDGVVCMDGTPSSRVETNDSDGVAPTMLAFPDANTETTYGIQIQRTGGSTTQDTRVTTGAVLVSRESRVQRSPEGGRQARQRPRHI